MESILNLETLYLDAKLRAVTLSWLFIYASQQVALDRLLDLNKGSIDQVLSVLNQLQPLEIYNENVFIFFLRALRAEMLRRKIWNFYSEKIKKRHRRCRRCHYGVRVMSFWNFFAQEINMTLAMHSHIIHSQRAL